MIIDKNSEVYNNIPSNAIGVCKELSIVELQEKLEKWNDEYHWGLVGFYNRYECAVNANLIEDKVIYRDICRILDRERAICLDRYYYKDNK